MDSSISDVIKTGDFTKIKNLFLELCEKDNHDALGRYFDILQVPSNTSLKDLFKNYIMDLDQNLKQKILSSTSGKEFIQNNLNNEQKKAFLKNLPINDKTVDLYLEIRQNEDFLDYTKYVEYIEYIQHISQKYQMIKIFEKDDMFKGKIANIIYKKFDILNFGKTDCNKIIYTLIKEDKMEIYNDIIIKLFKKNNDPSIIDMINKENIHDEYIDMINKNIEILKKYRPELNLERTPNINLQMLEDKILNKYGYQTIADIFEYNTNAYKQILLHANDNEVVNWINYMKNNNMYSRKLLHYTLCSFDEINDLLIELPKKNISLNDKQKKILYEIAKDKNAEQINSVEELLNYENIKKEKFFSILENSNSDIRNTFQLGDDNQFFDERMIINFYSKFLTNNEINSLLFLKRFIDKNISGLKSNVQNIDLDLIFSYKSAIDKIKKYYSKKMSESLIDLDTLKHGDGVIISSVDGENDKVKVIEMDGKDISILGTQISNPTQAGQYFKSLHNNLSMWNNQEGTSSISTSYYNNYMSFRGIDLASSNLVLGFTKIPDDSVFGMYYGDAHTRAGVNILDPGSAYKCNLPNVFSKKTDSTQHNEVALYRKSNSIDENGGRLQPSCILVDDKSQITPQKIHAAEYFKVPIVVLNTAKYIQRNEENYKKYKSLDIESFSEKDINNILYYNAITIDESYELINRLIEYSLSKEIIDNEKYIELKQYLSEKIKEFPTPELSEQILISEEENQELNEEMNKNIKY